MRVVIVYSPDTGFMSDFIFQIVTRYKEMIAGVIATQGSIIKRKGRLDQLNYLVALVIILGPIETLRMVKKALAHKINPDKRIENFCRENNIPFTVVSSVNSEACKAKLEELKPDIIFNQSQHIVKKKILDIPRIGTLNRHGAILPTFKGRLAPFWQILTKQPHGGLTYHLLDEGIDSGPIVWQQPIPITKEETVMSLTRKMFALAIEQFGPVVQMLDRPDFKQHLIVNDNSKSSYFTSPRIKDALKYRFAR